MAPTRSASLKKLSAVLFEEPEASCQPEADEEGLETCHFARTLSEDSTVPGQPFSRFTSPASSDGEPEPSSPSAHKTLAALPEAARHLRGHLAFPGPEVPHGKELIAVRPDGEASYVPEELIAVRPDGEASYVPEEELAAIEVLRATLIRDREEPSSLILVARDGTSYFVPDGSHVEWGKFEELYVRGRGRAAAPPTPAAGRPAPAPCAQPPSPRCAAARARRPLEPEAVDFDELEECSWVARKPEGSVPRSPSLKQLSKLLFAKGGEAAGQFHASTEPEELEMEAPCAKAKVASPSLPLQQQEPQPRPPMAWWAAAGCRQQ